MSLFKTFKTDSNKENEGIPIAYDPNDDGTIPTFIVARQSKANKKFQKAMREVSKPHQRKLDMGTLSDEVGTKLLRTAFVKGCLRSWENIQNEKGESIEFTEANAIDLFEKLPELFDDLQSQSTMLANYRTEDLEAEVKN